MSEKKAFPFLGISLAFVTLLSIVGIATSIFLYREWVNTKRLLANPSEASKLEVKELVGRMSKLMMLPDEEPELATVMEEEKLKDQKFFMNAKNGDKILIFTKAQKAILYRPSTHVIIDVAPLVTDPQSSASGQMQSPLRIALRNGTDTIENIKKMEDTLKATVQNSTIVERTNAKVKTYKETVVYDITGSNAEVAGKLAQMIGAKVGTTLPTGETAPKADFLIILGSDQK